MDNRAITRRKLLARAAAALGTAGLIGLPYRAAAEPPPEVSRIRLVHAPAICLAPQYLAAELLRLEGFTEIDYVEFDAGDPCIALQDGRADFTQDTASALLPILDESRALSVLGGLHAGCYELFGSDRVRTIRDLEGKAIAVTAMGASEHVFISSMLAYVGMDPVKDVTWVDAGSFDGPMELFINGKVDAFLGFAPQPQELRARNVGHVLIDTAQDRPWSQYYCCMVVGDARFVTQYPVATKRVLRAFLKAADICAREPERAARFLAEHGYEPRYAMGLEVLRSLPYNRWREADPEDTLRFHALRLYEVGMIRSTPQQIVARGSDLRFLNELRRELKA